MSFAPLFVGMRGDGVLGRRVRCLYCLIRRQGDTNKDRVPLFCCHAIRATHRVYTDPQVPDATGVHPLFWPSFYRGIVSFKSRLSLLTCGMGHMIVRCFGMDCRPVRQPPVAIVVTTEKCLSYCLLITMATVSSIDICNRSITSKEPNRRYQMPPGLTLNVADSWHR